MNKKHLFSLVLLFLASGCIKSRAQVEPDQEIKPGSPAYTQDAIDDLRVEISRLNGKIEELQVQQKSLPDLEILESRMSKLEQRQLELQEELTKIKEDLPPPNPIVYFNKGKELFKGGNFAETIQFMNKYLDSTTEKKGKTAQEAYFLVGESEYSLKNFKKAILAYDNVTRNFKSEKFQSKSYYKIAMSFESLGKEAEAQDFYQELVKKYPKSQEAKLAKKKIKTPLKKASKKKK